MHPVNAAALAEIAEQLVKLNLEFAFLGGAVLGFLLDSPGLVRLRVTDDVDAIVNIVTFSEYAEMEDILRKVGFHHDLTPGSPVCRWLYKNFTVDIMPVRDHTKTMTNQWFEYSLRTASNRSFESVTVPTISATCFVATKLAAFQGRGIHDLYTSHDLEDIITIVDGRATLVREFEDENTAIRNYVAEGISRLLAMQSFVEILPGLIEQDAGSQMRIPIILDKLKQLSQVAG